MASLSVEEVTELPMVTSWALIDDDDDIGNDDHQHDK